MDITLLVVIVIGAIVALGIAWAILNAAVIRPYRRRKRFRAWQDDERAKWFAKYQAAKTDEQLAELFDPDKRWVNAETDQIMVKIKLARVREKERILAENTAEAIAFYESVRQAPDARARWKLLKNPPYAVFGVKDGVKNLHDHMQQATKDYAELLLVEARGGNAKSFFKLSGMVHAGHYEHGNYLANAGKKYSFPNDWDELLTRFFKNPSVEQFHNQRDYAPNEILLVATEAMRTKDFIVAKLVLAYSMEARHHESGYNSARHSQKYWPFRAAIGEFLLTELAAMVDSVHVKQGLFQEATATPVTE